MRKRLLISALLMVVVLSWALGASAQPAGLNLPLVYMPPVALPTIPPPPTPTATPDPLAGVRYVGVTSQGRPVEITTSTDGRRVFKVVMEARVNCTTIAGTFTWRLTFPSGLPITNGEFEYRAAQGPGAYDILSGRFDAGMSQVEGDWEMWLPTADDPICSNTGTWQATRQ